MYSDDTEIEYTSPNQVRKLVFFGVLSALTAVPISQSVVAVINIIPLVSADEVKEWVSNAVVDVVADKVVGLITFVSRKLLEGIFGIIGWLFVGVTEELLVVPPPGTIDTIGQVWTDFFPIYWGFMPVAGAAFFLGLQLFPEKEEVSVYRFMERFFISAVGLVVTAPVWNYETDLITITDGFSAAVVVTNTLINYVGPESYNLSFMGGALNQLTGAMIGTTIVAGVIIAAVLVGVKFLISALLVIGTFWLVLGMRMLLIYVVYAMMPLLLALWVVDIGPLKYSKMVAEMVFKITGVLLLLGVVIAGILRTTGAIAGGETATPDQVELIDDPENYSIDSEDYTDKVEDGDDVEDAELTTPGVVNGSMIVYNQDGKIGGEFQNIEETDEPPGGFTLALLQIVAWFGGITLAIALSTSLLGMVLTTRGPSGTSSRMRQGRSGDAPAGTQVIGGGGGAAAGSGGGGGNTVVTQTDDGATIIENPQTDEQTIIDEDGNVSTYAPEPDDDDGLEGVPLTDKAKHLSDKYGGKAKDVGSKANSEVEDVTGMDVGGGVKDKVDDISDGYKDKKEAMAEKKESIAEAHPEAAGIAASGRSIAGKGWNTMKQAGGLAKRGGKAYWSAYKQPTVRDTIGEVKRIAKESPIGHPDKPEEPAETTPGDEDDMGDFDFYGGFETGDQRTGSGQTGSSSGSRTTSTRSSGTTTSSSGASGTSGGTSGAGDDWEVGEENKEFDIPDGSQALNQLEEDERIDLEDATYRHEQTYDIGDGEGGTKQMEVGYFEDEEAGEQVPQLAFGEDANRLEDGETYDVKGARTSEFNTGSQKAHSIAQKRAGTRKNGDQKSMHYNQAQIDDGTEVRKSSEAPRNNATQATGGEDVGDNRSGEFDVSTESAEAFGELMSTDMSGSIERAGGDRAGMDGYSGQQHRQRPDDASTSSSSDVDVSGESVVDDSTSDGEWSPGAEVDAGYAQMNHSMNDGVPPATDDVEVSKNDARIEQFAQGSDVEVSDSDSESFAGGDHNVYQHRTSEMESETDVSSNAVSGASPPDSGGETDIEEIDDMWNASYDEDGGVYESDGDWVQPAPDSMNEEIASNNDAVTIQSEVTEEPNTGRQQLGGYNVVDKAGKVTEEGEDVDLKSFGDKVRVEDARMETGDDGTTRIAITDSTTVSEVDEDASGEFRYESE